MSTQQTLLGVSLPDDLPSIASLDRSKLYGFWDAGDYYTDSDGISRLPESEGRSGRDFVQDKVLNDLAYFRPEQKQRAFGATEGLRFPYQSFLRMTGTAFSGARDFTLFLLLRVPSFISGTPAPLFALTNNQPPNSTSDDIEDRWANALYVVGEGDDSNRLPGSIVAIERPATQPKVQLTDTPAHFEYGAAHVLALSVDASTGQCDYYFDSDNAPRESYTYPDRTTVTDLTWQLGRVRDVVDTSEPVFGAVAIADGALQPGSALFDGVRRYMLARGYIGGR